MCLLLSMLVKLLLTVFLFQTCQSEDLCSVISHTNRTTYSTKSQENCGCAETRCIRKCCKLGFALQKNKICLKRTSDEPFQVPLYIKHTSFSTILSGRNISRFKVGILKCKFFKLDRDNPEDAFFIQENGDLWMPSNGKSYGNGEYCLDERNGLTAFVCFDNNSSELQEVLAEDAESTGMLISMPFLAITFIVYALLPDKNLYQYALMIYVLTLFLAYLQLVLINYITLIENEACILIGYLTLFSFTTSFFWLNVICFDIWFTFSRGRSIVGGRRSSEIKKLGFYSIYAFGVPLVLIILVYLLQTEFLDPLSIHNPKIGKGKCFLETGWPSLWYLYLEAGLIIIANLVFFSWTAVSIRKVKKETAMLKHNDSKRHAYEKSQKKFNLFIKLAFAMGINWSTEIISWFVNWQTDSAYSKIWIVTDCVNALYGVFIFFIFVFKKKTWRLLKRRYYAFRGKVYLAHSMGGTSSRPTNISTTESTVTTTVNGARRPEDNILLHDRR
ncbi:G-protein coupled receptor Mth2-like isoform X1 [Anthonomus grandis grandis]|uniref:G-protein coupled receptor Mth2-like isoform X1 n=1 Tax=Anthonomus grandis grandis TaxID=2921223 RepID=UPI0021662897|nr:G-protein coupled receptor Mth2-like isoform X1 [Anthonomus grandis grandis]